MYIECKVGVISYYYRDKPLTIFSERELTFTFAICRRQSVCPLSSVCNVRAPYSGD